MTRELYSDRCAAQVAAFFLYKAGGRLTILKLMKLLYLAERLSLQKYGEPITYDSLVSMPHGPVLSMTLNHINGMINSSPGGWDEWISDRENREVSLVDPSMIRSPELDLPALSETDLEVLYETWDRFGHMSASQLRNFTHDHCPEWKDPHGSSIPIDYRSLFNAFGFASEKTDALIERLEGHRYLNEAFAMTP